MSAIFSAVGRGCRFSVKRIVELLLFKDVEGVEAYLGLPTMLTALRLLQADGRVPLFVPHIPGVSRSLTLVLQNNAFWSHAFPATAVACLLIANALWMSVALVSNFWWARVTGVTVNLAAWFFFAVLLWLHLGPAGAAPYVGPLVAAGWVSRRLILDLHNRRQARVVTDQATRLAGEIVAVLLDRYPNRV